MSNYREIVTKAVVGKGKKNFINHYSLSLENIPSTILGCWVINHNFKGVKENNNIVVHGSFDVNIWYSYDNDTKTFVAQDTINYDEILNVNKKMDSDEPSEEIIVRCLSGPTCTKVNIVDGKVEYDIDKELGVELVGDTKMRIEITDDEDEWDDLNDDSNINNNDSVNEDIEKSVEEDFLSEKK